MAYVLPSREMLLSAVQSYFDAIEKDDLTQRTVEAMVTDLDELVPNANISDLIHWGEKERTAEEIIDEALCRQRIWRDEGELALLVHVHSQMKAVLDGPGVSNVHEDYARQTMKDVASEIARLRGTSLQ